MSQRESPERGKTRFKTEMVRARASAPEFQSAAEHVGEFFADGVQNRVRHAAGGEVGRDDQLVVEPVLARHDVVQMNMAEFVDLVAQMPLLDECHFHDQRFGLVKNRILVQPQAVRVAQIRDFRGFDLVCDVGARVFQVLDLLSRQVEKFLLELLASIKDHVAQRVHAMLRLEGFHDQFLGEFHRIAAFQTDQFAREIPVVEPHPDVQQPGDQIDEFFRKVNHRRGHFHHAPSRNVVGKHRQVVQVRMRDEPVRGPHEIPRLGAKVESKMKLGNVPERLDRRA